MDTEERALLSASVREVLTAPPQDVRRLLADLGWDEVVAADPIAATTVLFTEHGRALARTAALDSVVLSCLAADIGPDVHAVAYPRPGSGYLPGPTAAGLTGIMLREPGAGERVVVPVASDGGTALAVVDSSALTVTPVSTFDADLQWFTVTGAVPAELMRGDGWLQAVAAAHRALAAELVGVAREALRLGIEHTGSRRQFGHPLAAFQAVRHKLADAHVAITGAESLLDAAFLDGTPTSAAAAKAQAGRAMQVTAANCTQVSGAMGSTLEHPLPRYVARGVLLDALLGGWNRLSSELGALVQETGQTPLLVEV